jgi:hypothetical protein
VAWGIVVLAKREGEQVVWCVVYSTSNLLHNTRLAITTVTSCVVIGRKVVSVSLEFLPPAVYIVLGCLPPIQGSSE